MKKQHVLFSNYPWENDEYGKDHYDYAREVHDKLFNSNFYTRLPHYAHKVCGFKKGA